MPVVCNCMQNLRGDRLYLQALFLFRLFVFALLICRFVFAGLFEGGCGTTAARPAWGGVGGVRQRAVSGLGQHQPPHRADRRRA